MYLVEAVPETSQVLPWRITSDPMLQKTRETQNPAYGKCCSFTLNVSQTNGVIEMLQDYFMPIMSI